MKLDPNFNRLVKTLNRQQEDRVPILELIVDTEIKSAFLGRKVSSIKDDIEFWYRAGYDCATVYPGSPSIWFYNSDRLDTVINDDSSEDGTRRWASEGKGIIKDWADLEKYPIPTIDEIDFKYFDDANMHLENGMGIIGAWGDIFTYAWEAMGFQEFAYALFEREDFVAHVFNQLGILALKIYEVLVSYDSVKALWYSDDLAYRTSFMVSPKVYRKHLFPWLKKIGDLSHSTGRPFIFHSDGLLWDVMEDIIGCGFDSLHPIEPLAMDILEVKRKYGDRLSLVGNVDVDLLTRGTEDEIRQNVQKLLKDIAPGGGYCLGSGNTVPNYVSIENYKAMIEEALKS